MAFPAESPAFQFRDIPGLPGLRRVPLPGAVALSSEQREEPNKKEEPTSTDPFPEIQFIDEEQGEDWRNLNQRDDPKNAPVTLFEDNPSETDPTLMIG